MNNQLPFRSVFFSDSVYVGIILLKEQRYTFSSREVRNMLVNGESWHYPLPNPDVEKVRREVNELTARGKKVYFFRGTIEELKMRIKDLDKEI